MVVINSDDCKLGLQVATQETAVARLEISIPSSPYSNLDRLNFQRSLMSVHRSSGVHMEIAVTISCTKPPLPRVTPFNPRECVDGFTPSVYYRQRTSPTLASCSEILLYIAQETLNSTTRYRLFFQVHTKIRIIVVTC